MLLLLQNLRTEGGGQQVYNAHWLFQLCLPTFPNVHILSIVSYHRGKMSIGVAIIGAGIFARRGL